MNSSNLTSGYLQFPPLCPQVHVGLSTKFLNKQHAKISDTPDCQWAQSVMFIKCHFLLESAVNRRLACIPETDTGSYCWTPCGRIPPFRDSDMGPCELCHRSKLLPHLRGAVCDMQTCPVRPQEAFLSKAWVLHEPHPCVPFIKNSFYSWFSPSANMNQHFSPRSTSHSSFQLSGTPPPHLHTHRHTDTHVKLGKDL